MTKKMKLDNLSTDQLIERLNTLRKAIEACDDTMLAENEELFFYSFIYNCSDEQIKKMIMEYESKLTSAQTIWMPGG